MLDDLRRMGSADIFIPSGSYFSGFASYFLQPESVVVLGSPPAIGGYLCETMKHGCKVLSIQEPDELRLALQKLIDCKKDQFLASRLPDGSRSVVSDSSDDAEAATGTTVHEKRLTDEEAARLFSIDDDGAGGQAGLAAAGSLVEAESDVGWAGRINACFHHV